MQQAILKVLKDGAGTYAFPGGTPKIVDLFCNGLKTVLTEVIINSSFTEFATYAAGRITALKISSDCETVYAIAAKNDVANIINCCNNTINAAISMSCSPVTPPVTVKDVLGNTIGPANTPAEYVTAWNGNSNNQLIGTLYAGNGWNFILKYFPNQVRPVQFDCETASGPICPTVTFTNLTNSSITANWTATENATKYFFKLEFEGQTSGFITGETTQLTHAFTGLTASTLYHLSVTPFVGSYGTLCTPVNFTTQAADPTACPDGVTAQSPAPLRGDFSFYALANTTYILILSLNSDLSSPIQTLTVPNTESFDTNVTQTVENLPEAPIYYSVSKQGSTVTCPGFQVLIMPDNFRWTVSDNQQTPLTSINFDRFVVHTKETDVSMNLTGIDFNNKWFAARTKSDESDFLGWFNTNSNNGFFPDTVFETPLIIGNFKYYYSKVAFSLDNTAPLNFEH